jgi:phosphoglycerate dehydrogenase-like enzyme
VGKRLPPDPVFQVLVAGVPGEENLDASPRLGMLIIPWAGLPRSTRELALHRPHVAVHNIHHNADAAAEMAVALLLAAAKLIVPMDRDLRSHDWSGRYLVPNPSVMLRGGRALVLGYGALGQRIAEMCRGLGMEVRAVRRRPERTDPSCPDEIHGAGELEELLPEADALLVALPLTEATKGLISERRLRLLPRHAVLVNVARGPIVEESALFHALRDGALKGAGLDVWYNYPSSTEERTATRPSIHPFHELDNVVMSPHRAGAFGEDRTERMRMDALARSLNAAAAGEPVPHRVDVAEGY